MSARPRVLMIAPQPFFSPRGTPFSVYYRTLVMTEKGADVDLLTYGEGQDVEIPNARIVRIPRIPGTQDVPLGPSFKKLVLDVFMVAWTLGLLLRHRYQVVHAHEEAVFWSRALKPLFGFKLIYDMHSSLPQQITNFQFSKSKLLIGAFRLLEDWSLDGADAVVTICPELSEYALGRGVPPDQHLLIENSIFDDVVLAAQPAPGAPHKSSAPVELPRDRTLVLYAGTFEPYQGVELLVQAFARIAKQAPNATLLLVGGTPEQVAAVRGVARELELGESCVFTGRVTKTEALRLTAAAHVLVSPRRSGTNTPLKIYEQLASGKPLVATNISSHTQILTDDVCFLVAPEPDALADGLLAALRDPARSAHKAANARALYDRCYARSIYEDKIGRLLERVRDASAPARAASGRRA